MLLFKDVITAFSLFLEISILIILEKKFHSLNTKFSPVVYLFSYSILTNSETPLTCQLLLNSNTQQKYYTYFIFWWIQLYINKMYTTIIIHRCLNNVFFLKFYDNWSNWLICYFPSSAPFSLIAKVPDAFVFFTKSL